MNTKHLLYIVAVIALLLFTAPMVAHAYVIPEEYRTSDYMNSVETYLTSMAHIGEVHPVYGLWANDNLRQLAMGYTNNGKLDQLVAKMNWYLMRLN